MSETRLWSCEGCSYHLPGKGCRKPRGCDFIPAMVRLEKLLSG